MKQWDAQRDLELSRLHGTMPIADVAMALGATKAAVRGRVTRLGIAKKDEWTAEQTDGLRRLYAAAGASGVLGLSAFAASIGKNKANVCRKAKALGLSVNPNRKMVEARKDRRKFATTEELRAHLSESAKRRIAEGGHPKGMLGKAHTQETRAALSEANKKRWQGMTQQEREAQTMKAVDAWKAGAQKGAPRPRGAWKAGWREIGGKRNYYRSRWEANYARYLQWLKERGQIQDWEHEPETFWFDAIKRGVRSYLPDFRVWENGGASHLHEVKGWMCPRSKTTLARMAKYHPSEKIVVIDGRQYRAIRLKVMALIPEWEDAARDSHA